MPLTDRGRAIIERLPEGAFRAAGSTGCQIVRHEELCVGCGRCATTCPSGASSRGETFDPQQLFDAPADSRRGALGAALRSIARHAPAGVIEVPARVTVFRTIVYDDEQCLGCGACARTCPSEAIEALAPKAGAAAAGVSADSRTTAATPTAAPAVTAPAAREGAR
jgi:NAD-dependent dihydropyrimidine dehydrogenase PreA subunit